MYEEIKKLKELLDMGALTQAEFDLKKTEILNRAAAPVQPSRPAQTTAYQYSQPTQASQASFEGSSEKSKVAAGLLAIFLGTLGIHKFYLGNTTEGVIMILVTIFGGLLFGLGIIAMAIIALIEGIIYLTKSDTEFNRIYVQGSKGWF